MNAQNKKATIPPEIKEFFKVEGKRGGQNTLIKHGTNHFVKIGKLAAKKRWANHRKKSKGKVDKLS